MRQADLENLVKELLKRIEVLEDAHETNIDIDNGDQNSGSEPTKNGLNPSEPGSR